MTGTSPKRWFYSFEDVLDLEPSCLSCQGFESFGKPWWLVMSEKRSRDALPKNRRHIGVMLDLLMDHTSSSN